MTYLDKDTEVLTENGWVKISDYSRDNKIMVFNLVTNEAYFVEGLKTALTRWRSPRLKFYHFKNSKGLDQKVSSGSDLLVYSGHKNRGYKVSMTKPKELLGLALDKRYRTFKTSFDLSGGGLGMDEKEIRLTAMISADGTYRRDFYGYSYELHFKKERKIKRATELLNECNIDFKRKDSDDGTTYFYFKVEERIDKSLKKFFMASKRELYVLFNEALFWDGHINDKDQLYYSTDKTNADVIQFAITANNIRGGLYKLYSDGYKENWKAHYQVRITSNNMVAYADSVTVEELDEECYSITVPTRHLVARRENKIFVI